MSKKNMHSNPANDFEENEKLAKANQTVQVERGFEKAIASAVEGFQSKAEFKDLSKKELERQFQERIEQKKREIVGKAPLLDLSKDDALSKRMDQDVRMALSGILNVQAGEINKDLNAIVAELLQQHSQAVSENPEHLVEAIFIIRDKLSAYTDMGDEPGLQSVADWVTRELVLSAIQSLISGKRFAEAHKMITSRVSDPDLEIVFSAQDVLSNEDIQTLVLSLNKVYKEHVTMSLQLEEYHELEKESQLASSRLLAVEEAIKLITGEGASGPSTIEQFAEDIGKLVEVGVLTQEQSSKLIKARASTSVVDDDAEIIVDCEIGLAFENLNPEEVLQLAADGRISSPTLKALRQRIGMETSALRRVWTQRIADIVGEVAGRLSVVKQDNCERTAEALGKFRHMLEQGHDTTEAGELILSQYAAVEKSLAT